MKDLAVRSSEATNEISGKVAAVQAAVARGADHTSQAAQELSGVATELDTPVAAFRI